MRISIFSWNFCFKNCHFTKVRIELYLWCFGVFVEYIDIWHSWPYKCRVFIFSATLEHVNFCHGVSWSDCHGVTISIDFWPVQSRRVHDISSNVLNIS